MRYSYVPGSAAADARAMAAAIGGTAPPAPPFVILRPAAPYDLATPGTPLGIVQVARAAEQGATLAPPGGWRHWAALAVATTPDGARTVATLALRLTGDLPGRTRRAWIAYQRTDAGGWRSSGAGMLDTGAPTASGWPARPIGIEELKATLRGEVWVPPAPPQPAYTVPCPTCKQPTRITNAGKIYANHRCETAHVEGRS